MSAFSIDELAAQALAGESSSGKSIRTFMPDQHREFFSLLSYLFVGAGDEGGWPVSTILAGAPGFVTSPDSTTLRIDALPTVDDPLAQGIRQGAEIGLLGLDLSNRRRNRANGHITTVDADGFTVHVSQSFGNCAKYIQTRFAGALQSDPKGALPLACLSDEAARLVAKADTFFVASRSRPGISNGGFDVSHRGGQPGFVNVRGDTLVIPEFSGNRYFNTLGNLLSDRRAGLLFIDFDNGDLLQLQGKVTIDWSGNKKAPDGALRVWQCQIERGWLRPCALPIKWKFGASAPTTLATGPWKSQSPE